MLWLKMLGIVVLFVLVLLAVAISFTMGWRPFLGPRARALDDRAFPSTPQRVERGRYLAEDLMGCFDCHSPRDWKKHDAPLLPGTEGEGQLMPLAGLPGKVVAPNITPDPETGVGRWSDDQLARAVREGIGADGRALFPLMPYASFRSLCDEDLAALVVYLRTLPPVRNALPKTQLDFPVNRLINDVPQPLMLPVPPPDISTPQKRGRYLVALAGCADCHTPTAKGERIVGLEFAGGRVLEGPWGRVASTNITSDPSGIPYYDEKLFLEMMRSGTVRARELSPIMPWWRFRDLRNEDLKAIFASLRQLSPIKHRVDNTEPAGSCKVCGGVHGGGGLN